MAGEVADRCQAMHEAAQVLVGQHDFTTFRAAECQAASPVKTLDRLDVERTGDEIRIQPRPGHSCITRCARLSARCNWSGRNAGARTICARRLNCGIASVAVR